MNLRTRALWIVFKKDLLDLIRDRRTLFAVVVLPLLFYPLLFIGFSQMTFLQNRKLEKEVSRIQIQGQGNAPALVIRLKREKDFQLTSSPEPEQALAKGELDLIFVIPSGFQEALDSDKTAHAELIQDSSRDRSSAARRKVEAFLESYARETRKEYLVRKGMDPSILTPLRIRSKNIASPQKMGGKILGLLLPFLLVQMTLLGTLHSAIDLTAGERERKTLETLLVTPASRMEIVVGKYLVVMVVGFFSTFFNMISMTLTFSSSLMGYAKLLEQAHVEIRLSLSSGLWILLLMIPLTALFAGLTLAVASFARSFREASNYLGPLSLVAITPGFVVFLPGFEISWNLAWVPVVNVVLLLKQIMLGEFAWPLILTVFLSNALYGFLALRVVCAVFEGEEILLSSGEEVSPWSNLLTGLKGAGRASRSSQLSLSGAFLIFFVCLALLLYVGPSVQRRSLLSGILVVEFGLILFPCILFLRSWGISLTKALCLKAPHPIQITGAIGTGMTMWVAALLAFWVQSQFFPVGNYFEDLERALGAQRQEHPIALLLIASVAPGICEEVLFRGVLQPVFIRRWGFWQGILLSAFLFGAFHMMLPKLIPAMVLGIFLGYLAARTGSLYVSMTAHAVNNYLALFFSTTDFAGTGKLLGEHGEFLIWWVPVVAVLILVVSLQAVRARPQNQG